MRSARPSVSRLGARSSSASTSGRGLGDGGLFPRCVRGRHGFGGCVLTVLHGSYRARSFGRARFIATALQDPDALVEHALLCGRALLVLVELVPRGGLDLAQVREFKR